MPVSSERELVRCSRSNLIRVWAAEVIAVRLFAVGTAFFCLVPYNHPSVTCGKKKKVLLSGTIAWKIAAIS